MSSTESRKPTREKIVAELQLAARDGAGILADSIRSVLLDAAAMLHEAPRSEIREPREPVSDVLRDALRYRWLVNKRISGVGVPCLAAFSRRSQSLEQCQDSSDDIDAAIDREMEAYRG